MKIKANTDAFVRDLLEVVKVPVSQGVIDEMAMEVRRVIIERTQEGLDVTGSEFKPYSEEPIYISLDHRPSPTGGERTPRTSSASKAMDTKRGSFSFSAKTGKRTKAKGKSMFFPGGYRQYKAAFKSDTPDLTATGKMFSALMVRRDGQTRVLYFATDEANQKAVGNEESRPFFGICQRDGEEAHLAKKWEELTRVDK